MPEKPCSRLLDRGRVAAEYGLSRVDIDRVFRVLPVTALEGSRKVYVTRAALEELLSARTFDKDVLRPTA